MSPKVSLEDKRRIVCMRALDYTKQEIADEIGVSRNTIDYHLKKIREDVEDHESTEMALAKFLFERDQLPAFALEVTGNSFKDMDSVEIPISFTESENNDE